MKTITYEFQGGIDCFGTKAELRELKMMDDPVSNDTLART